jgi:two-component system, OmpR family, sensor kinase
MAPTKTIARRLILVASVATTSIVGVFWLSTIVLVDHQLRSSLDSGLRSRAVDVAELAVSDPAVLTEPGALESPSSGRQIAVEVLDARGRILARSLTLGAEVLPIDALVRAVLTRGRAGFEDVDVGGRPFRLYAAPIADAEGAAAGGAVLVASTTSDISSTVSRLGLLLALAGLAIAALGIAAVATLTARATAPLRRLAASAGEIRATADASRRLPDTSRRDELGQLTIVLNGMLDSLERAQLGERRFLADASHELRTPVTSLIGNIEYVIRHGVEPGVLDDLRADAERLGRLVDDLLVLERQGAGSRRVMADVALDDVVRSVVADAAEPRVVLARIAPVRVAGDEAALRRAVANLVENALVHGPAGGTVEVGVARIGDRARVTVSDAGPGPAEDERERVFERFWRGDAAAGRPGSGLGLSIVAGVAAAHGGQVTIDGSAFTLALPLLSRSDDRPPPSTGE